MDTIKEVLLKTAQAQDIEAIMKDPSVPKIYGNGFTFGFSLTDASIVIQHGNNPVTLLTLTFSSLKTLNTALTEVIGQIENNFGEPIKGLGDMKELISTAPVTGLPVSPKK